MSDESETGERIAKVMARAGVASRRDAEKMILAGRVAVNGVKAASPALDVMPGDKVTLDGKPIDAPQPARLWLYYKPVGLVTSAKDEKGRQTVFDTMPEGMPRVMSIGRLDLTSEGLLLLTNDGELKRRLELPTTGWLRKYRVRVNGRPNDATFDPLRRGVTIEDEEFQPMEVTLDKQQGANAWLTVGLREGKNREIRRAMAEVGLTVNRLIRVSYGPFRLNTMKPGDVVEVKQRVLREQLGDGPRSDEKDDRPARGKPRTGAKAGPGRDRSGGERPDRPAKPFRAGAADDRPRKPRPLRAEQGAEEPRGDRPARFGAKPPRRDRDGDAPRGGKPFPRRSEGEREDRPFSRPRKPRPAAAGGEDRVARGPRDGAPGADRPRGAGFAKGPRPKREDGGERPARKSFGGGEGRSRADRPRDDAKAGDRPWSGRPKGPKPEGTAPREDRKRSDKPKGAGPKGERPEGDRFRSDKPRSDKPRSDRPRSDKPGADRQRADKPRTGGPRPDRPKGDGPGKGGFGRPGGRPGGSGAPGGPRPKGKGPGPKR